MGANTNLHAAKAGKNDEFYTQIEDIEKELRHYKRHFKGKTVFLNCDDPRSSHFWIYFLRKFEFLRLKKLISTHYEPDGPSYKLEVTGDGDGDGEITDLSVVETPLKGNGDFRSPECAEILKEADIVVTNPPFSLFREYIAQLVENGKKFLVIGSMNAITYKEIFPLIKAGKLWLGNTAPKVFIQPDGSAKHFGNILWYTNLTHKKRSEELTLWREYGPDSYPTYDNYDAIEVSRVKDIPVDYDGAMGVPITFLMKHNPRQFEIVGMAKRGAGDPALKTKVYTKDDYANYSDLNAGPVLAGPSGLRNTYPRIIIRRRAK